MFSVLNFERRLQEAGVFEPEFSPAADGKSA
jgi:hypothetical protein